MLKWFEKSKYKKVCNQKIEITFIEDYKNSHKSKFKMPSKIALRKLNILLGVFKKRQRFIETRTIRAVEHCRKLVLEEIEKFFENKEKTINSFLPELIIGEKSYAHIFNHNDLEKIYRKTENIILNELFKRYKNLIVGQLTKANYGEGITNILSPILKYQNTKKRTVLITSYIETLSRRTLSDLIESLMKNSLMAKLVCNIDISRILLPKLGINSALETMELNEELFNRISGALYSIKLGLVQELNHQIANSFYKTHDLLLNSVFEYKIQLLEEQIARTESYETNLLEA